MRKSGLIGPLLAFLLVCLASTASAQWVVPDPAFPDGAGPDFFVRNTILQTNGAILIGGLFTNIDGVAHPHFGRLYPSGKLDPSFNPQLDGEPTHIELLSDQRILVSGSFTNAGAGALRPGLAILLQDGSPDSTFIPPYANGIQLSGMLAPDDSVFVGGSFTNLSGLPRNHLARLLNDGSVDPGFLSPFDPTNNVFLQTVQPDGKSIVSGMFSNVAGISVTNLVRLNPNGSVDTTFLPALAPNEQVSKAWLQPDGRLLVLTRISTFPELLSRLVRLETNGSFDASFQTGFGFPGFPWNARLSALAFQPDGKILLAGNFLQVNGVPRATIARLQNDGTLDFCFDVALSDNLLILALAPEPDGTVLVGGSFNGLQGQLHPNLMRLVPPPTCVSGVIQLGVSNSICRTDSPRLVVPVVRSAGEDRDETVSFSTHDGTAVSGVDYLAANGTLHFSPGQRSQSIVVPLVYGGASNGPVTFQINLTGTGGGASLGQLTNAVVTLLPAVAGTAGSPDTNYLVQLDAPVRFVLPMPDGAVVLVGDFTNVDGQLCPNLARLRPDGSRDPNFTRNLPLDGFITSAALDATGRVLIGGYFQHVDGAWRPGLARFGTNGILDPSFAPFDAWTNASGSSVEASALCVLADGGIVCGAYVPATNYGSSEVLLKFSSSGQLDTAFTNHLPPSVLASALVALPDGDFFVIGLGLGDSLVRLHPDGTVNLDFIPPADLQITYYSGNGVGLLADRRVMVAGVPSAYYGLPNQPDLWRLNPDGSLDSGFVLPASFGSFGPLDFVNTMDVSPDGRVLVAGSFSNGPVASLARFLPDGSPDLSFDSGTGLATRNANSYISLYALTALPQGGWLLGGDFGSYDGFSQPYLVKILPEQITRPTTFELAVTNTTVWETNGTVTVEVIRTGDASTAATVTVSTQDGTAIAGQDYFPLTTNLNFAPGEWSKTVSVAIIDDKIVEPLEQFNVRLSNPTAGFTVGSAGVLTVQIRDDDSGVQFVATQFNAVEEEGFAMIGVQWSGLLSNGLSVVANIVPLIGHAQDLGVSSTTITYTGTTTNWFRVPIIDNGVPDGLRQFRIDLAASANLIPGPQSNAVLSITDRDFPTFPARGVAGIVEVVANSSQGGVYLAGDFTGVNGVPLNRLARLTADGQVDTAFSPGVGPDSDITAIAEQPDGKLLIAGPFTSVSGVARAGLARLNHDGSMDFAFDAGAGIQNTNGLAFVRALLPQHDGTIWVAGAFSALNNYPTRLLAKLHSDGSIDTTYRAPFTSGIVAIPSSVPSSAIYSLLPQPDGTILAGGRMYVGTGLSTIAANVIRLSQAGLLDQIFYKPFGISALPTPLTIALDSQGRVLAGSTVYSRTGLDTNWAAVVLLQTNGMADPAFRVQGAPRMSYYESETRQLLVQPDGKILFSAAIYDNYPRTVPSPYLPGRAVIGRLLPDGTWDSTFALITCDVSEAMQLPGPFYFNNLQVIQRQPLLPIPAAAIVQQPDGVIVLGGTFNSVNNEPRRRLARLDPDGDLRGRLQLSLTGAEPKELLFPPEIETPYIVETSTDLVHWSSWVQNDYPWWPLQLPLSTDSPARYFRAKLMQPTAP